jgi:hypothetical protein
MNPEAIRRILKSKWTPTPEEYAKRVERWNNFKKARKRLFTDGVLTEFYNFRKDATLLRKYRPGFKDGKGKDKSKIKIRQSSAVEEIRIDMSGDVTKLD